MVIVICILAATALPKFAHPERRQNFTSRVRGAVASAMNTPATQTSQGLPPTWVSRWTGLIAMLNGIPWPEAGNVSTLRRAGPRTTTRPARLPPRYLSRWLMHNPGTCSFSITRLQRPCWLKSERLLPAAADGATNVQAGPGRSCRCLTSGTK